MNRFKELRIKHGYSQQELADMLFVNQTAVSQWERDTTSPSKETLLKLCELYSTTSDYLLGRGDGDDFDFSNMPDNIYKIETRTIPMLGSIAAGVPIYAEENFEFYVKVGAEIKADFCLTVKGDSMINARINDGDLVFIRKQSSVNDGFSETKLIVVSWI